MSLNLARQPLPHHHQLEVVDIIALWEFEAEINEHQNKFKIRHCNTISGINASGLRKLIHTLHTTIATADVTLLHLILSISIFV